MFHINKLLTKLVFDDQFNHSVIDDVFAVLSAVNQGAGAGFVDQARNPAGKLINIVYGGLGENIFLAARKRQMCAYVSNCTAHVHMPNAAYNVDTLPYRGV